MRAIRFTTRLLIASVGFCGSYAADSPSEARYDLQSLFQSLVTAEGASYFTTRSNLLAHGSSAVSLLEAKRGSRDLNERVLAEAALSWIGEAPTNYLRTQLLGALLRDAFRRRDGGSISAIQSVSFGALTWKGPLQPRDALHDDAAVPFLLEVALKGPTPVPDNPLLAWIAKDHPRDARCMATALVGGYKGSDVLPVLRELLHSPDSAIRACAATGVGKTKTMDGTEMLGEALADPDPLVREECCGALRDLTDQDFGEDRDMWRKWWQDNKAHWPFNDRVPGHSWAQPLPPLPAKSDGGTDK